MKLQYGVFLVNFVFTWNTSNIGRPKNPLYTNEKLLSLVFLTFDEIVLNKRVYFKFILLILTNDSSNFKPNFF